MPSTINFLRLIADPTRLRVLLLLEQEELSVAELQEILGMGQSRISSHLAQLKRAGAVVDRRAGKNVYYGLTRVIRANGAAPGCRSWSKLWPARFRKRRAIARRSSWRCASARTKRANISMSWPENLAEVIVPGRSWEALAHILITLLPPLTVADLGAGEGTLAQLLAKNARKVIAVDNSPKMVEFASQLAKKHGFRNIEYRLGDMQEPPIAKNSVDLAIFSQALHHAIRGRNARSRARIPF